jgi:sugar phosphate isomerase/epimerase
MMKFSATVTLQYNTDFSPFCHEDWMKGLDWIKQSGLDGAELCISHYNGVDIPRIKEELDKRGLECSTLSTGQARGREGLSLIGVPKEICKTTQERFKQHIDAAAILGSKVTIGLMRGIGSIETRDRDLRDLREAMMPLVDYADRKGVTVILEAINRYETALLNSAEEDFDFIVNDLGNPDCVGILWDLFHANIEDADFYHSIKIMGNKLQHVHIADSNRMFPGYGHTDFDGILKAVCNSGYSEYCSFECFNLPSLETVLKKTGPWVDHIRSL